MTAPDTMLLLDCELPLGPNPGLWAVVVRDGRIDSIRPMADAPSASGARVVRVDGASVLPGFTDAHVHVVESGIELMRCDLADAVDRRHTLELIAAYTSRDGESPWVVGRGWHLGHFQDVWSMLADLDALTGERPAYLSNRDGHSAWVNSAALRLAGIGDDTADPAGGRIERDADGRLVGLLHESAMQLVSELLPPLDDATRHAGLLAGQERLFALGVTGWQEAIVGDFVPTTDVYEVYRRAAASGDLVARVTGNAWVPRTDFGDSARRFVDLRDALPVDGRFRLTGAKIMYDGVCETFTAALSEPYRAETEYPSGLTFFDLDALSPVAAELDEAGFDLHIHAIGDRAVADSIHLLAGLPSGRDRRHQIAHLQVTTPALIERMARADIIGNIQPFWAQADEQMLELTLPFLPEGFASHQYEFASMAAAGVRLAFGSDWPVSTPNPFDQVHVAVNRAHPGGGEHPFVPYEAISRRAALMAATAGSAYAARQERHRGRLVPGLEADLVVLDRPLSAVDDGDLHAVRVAQTFVGGLSVFEA